MCQLCAWCPSVVCVWRSAGHMDFSAVSRSARGGTPDFYRDSAAAVVGSVNPRALLDNTSGRVAKAARNSVAAVVSLIRTSSTGTRKRRRPQEHDARGAPLIDDGGAHRWRTFDAELQQVRTQLARHNVPSQVFQAQLLLALRREDFTDHGGGGGVADREKGAGAGTLRDSGRSLPGLSCASGEPHSESAVCRPLDIYWRLHTSGLLPLSRLLEANEVSPSPFLLGHRYGNEGERDSFEEPAGDCADTIVQDIRALVVQSAAREANGQRREDATALISDVVKHLFDVGYRNPAAGFTGLAGARSDAGDVLSSRAARRVLDLLCCGPEVFGAAGTEVRWRGCLVALDAIDPVAESAAPLEDVSAWSSKGSVDIVVDAAIGIPTGGAGVPEATGDVEVRKDDRTTAFLARQLRLLMERSSEQADHSQGDFTDGTSVFAIEMAVPGNADGALVDIMRHFSPALFIEVLRSICRQATARAADATGFHLHKPLLRWEILGPIVRAAATAHAQKIPPAIVLIGTELAAAAVNLAPSGDDHASRTVACNQKQGVLVLSAALRLVAQADASLQGARQKPAECGLYAQWVRSCFGAGLPNTDGGVVQEAGQAEVAHVGQEQGTSDMLQEAPCLRGWEALREAMEKQRATELLMEALCLSVPRDPAVVLEVHRDVLKSRLRAKFSVQIRDLLDLVVIRLSDLNGQNEARKRKGTGSDHDRSPGTGNPADRASSHLQKGFADPVTKEVGFFLRQFKRTGDVPPALKTAILWQPKLWAGIRKVLLAPPGERIAMPDDSGSFVPAGQGVVKESIGRGENGLRVEVSLKYRRLLVQKLAKESLLSAKDHDNFRNAFIEYLQGQRKKDPGQTETPETSEAASTVARQLVVLESKLNQRQQAENRQDHEDFGGVNETKGDGAAVRERLALLLQEYLPRALVVGLCMEDGDELRCRASPTSADEAGSHLERPSNTPPDRDWFARASRILARILEEWERCLLAGTASEGATVSETTTQRDPSPDEVADAILDSIHCCVYAIGVSLVHDLGLSVSPPMSTSIGDAECLNENSGGSGICQNQEPGTGRDEATAPLRLPGAKALQRVGEVVAIAAGGEVLGEALWQRCSSLLTNPNMLDPKQVLTLTHILASLPPSFHPKVERLLTDLVAKVLSPKPGLDCANSNTRSNADRCGRSSANEKAGFVATAQVGVLYLQSTLLLLEKNWTCTPEKVCGSSLPDSRMDPAAQKFHNSQMPASSEKQSLVSSGANGAAGEMSISFGKGSAVGFAPVFLLDFLWWMEQRISVAQATAASEPRGGTSITEELVGLLQRLQTVMRHPSIARELKQTFAARGAATMPPLERLLAFEVAVSRDRDFCGPWAKLAFLEHVTLGRLVVDLTDSPEGSRSSSINTGKKEGAILAPRQQGGVRSSNTDVAAEVIGVWKQCAECLFGNPSLRVAAHRRVCRNSTLGEPSGVFSWESCTHPSWDERDARGEGVNDLVDAEGVQTLLDCVLQVMEKLCTLEATASSMRSRRLIPAADLDQTVNIHDARNRHTNSGRGATVLLTEAVGLLKQPEETMGGAVSSALVLVTATAIPAIGASEGREKAIDSLRAVWEDYLCKVRPLKFGAIASSTRLALTWCGGQSDTRNLIGDSERCPVVRMLEDLPLLAAEMVRVWPRLARILQPVIGVPSPLDGPYALGGWASHLNKLHIFGKDLVISLVGGGLELSKAGGELRANGGAIPSTVRQTPSDSICRERASSRKDGRIPLGPVNDRTPGRRVGARAQGGGQECPSGDHQGGRGSVMDGKEADGSGSDAASVLADRCQESLCDASTALPRTCAELIVGAVDAAAAALSEAPTKRSTEAAASSGNPKRAKMGSTSMASLSVNGCNESIALGGMHVRGKITAVNTSRGATFRPPPSTGWEARVLKPLYGSGAGKRVVSSLSVLLEALVSKLAYHRTCAMPKGSAGAIPIDGISQRLTASLVVAILEYAPPLVAHMAGATCVLSSTTPTAARERLGRSLAVLDSLRLLLEDIPPRQTNERGPRLGAILVNYASALLSMSSMQKEAEGGCDAGMLPDEHDWAGVVAFVHTRVGAVAPEELRLMPAALAAQEVDPLLKQYF